MPTQRVDANLDNNILEEEKTDNKESDNDDVYKRSSIYNSESEDESIVYHIPETKTKHSTPMPDKDVEEISKNFSGITIDVKSKGPINNPSIFRQHESRPLLSQHDHGGANNNLNGGYLIDNNPTLAQQNIFDNGANSYLNGGYLVENSASLPQNVLDDLLTNPVFISALENIKDDNQIILVNDTPDHSNNSILDLVDPNIFNPVPLQPTSRDQEFLRGDTERSILDLLDFNVTSQETSVSGNEGISYRTPSPNYSTSSSTADDFSRNIEQTQKDFDVDDRDVRVFENVMSSWSEKTGNKIGVWIKVNVSDEYYLITELRKKLMSQGNRDDDKILYIYAIIHRLMKPRTKKETIDTRSLLRNLYKNTNNLLWLVAQQKHVDLFNYFIETVQNLEIQISEIIGQEIFLHQLAKCQSAEMVDILAAALAYKTRGLCNTLLFNINSPDYSGLTPVKTVLSNLSQQQSNSERYLRVKQSLQAILDARPDLEESNYLQFAKDLNLPPEIYKLLGNHNRVSFQYDFNLHSFNEFT